MDKNKRKSQYLNHQQNTSPAKTCYSFSKSMRFPQLHSESPSRYYQPPSVRSRRATSLGFGSKTVLMNKNTGDPGSYIIKSVFDKGKIDGSKNGHSSSTFGESHNQLYNREITSRSTTPGPTQYRPVFKTARSNKFSMEERFTDNCLRGNLLGPQTYNIKTELLSKISKFKGTKGFRIKTQSSGDPRYDISRFDNRIPGPNMYSADNQMTIESLMKNKKIKGAGVFSKEERLKLLKPSRIGPGSYSVFSAFGNEED